MPSLIEHIDAIGRKKQRDVLYVVFYPKRSLEDNSPYPYDWNQDSVRETICNWLTEHNIAWEPCGDIASENVMCSYRGQIYLDVPFDDNDPDYVRVCNYLENPDGSTRFDTVGFRYLPLAAAMKNAHHDEPGFWDKWAENF